MKHFVTAFLVILFTLPALAQTTFSIRGRVLDKVTGETLPGATVQVTGNGKNTGAGADADGSYKVSNLPAGTYTVQASFIGYKPNTQTVKISTQSVVASFTLASDNASLDEVQVVASQAQERETPVAFAAVNEVKLRETLSNRDLPMILNETPGVYATQGAGGGTGDSRINVRGFDQRNVAVLINGVPVNDMENGQVYWSNWDLGDVTKSLQVQRGLSAAKITVPSVGGTINVLTKGFDDKRSIVARAETGSNNYQKYSLMLSSGQLKGDWAVTAYGARRTQDGWVDKTFDDAWTFFGTVSKRIGKHTLSLTGMGSPQSHGQRIPFGERIGVYSNEKALELGATPQPGGDKGFRYNKGWGYLDRYTLDGNGNRISHGQEVVNERVNYFFKPQVNLNHFWNVTDRLFVSTVLYASKGTGGGSQAAGSTFPTDASGQDNIQKVYDDNYKNVRPDGQRQSTQFITNLVNSHRWYGLVSGFDYLLKPSLTLSAGVDARYYYGIHYNEIRDLLGGDYAEGTGNLNAAAKPRLKVGDKYSYYNDSKTGWLGGYGQLEYKTPLLSAVVSGTVSRISYARIDYFRSKQVTVDGKNYDVIYGATPLVINGQSYTNADGHYLENDWVNITGYSVKAGANYNLTEHDNLFANIGYNSKVPFYQFVFNNSGQKFKDIRNEGISSFELGYGISYPSLKVSLNAYYTYWANKSSNSTTANPAGGTIYNNVRNVDARHMGIEMSVAQEISRRLQLNAAISLGDWRWAGNGVLNQTDDNNQLVGTPDTPIYLKGVHVGDAAQNQFQIGLRYEPVNNFYIRPSFLLFTKYYAGFNPVNLLNEASRTDTYRVPTSRNLDVHLGYDLPKRLFGDKIRLGLKGSVLNVLNEFYITDVPASTSATDPSLLQGFFNRGRTFTVGLSATL
ncbi:TonB-dependent receptor [Hymenobacter negativus]|uniref:TonB-dependent receptor n=1 Tax=Hymenobacter negativus TaxID=2795026 RepID=A0ABS0Q527_9BACT|nr:MULTISPECIES: TonB-dependent receptor [Bacteria]MBH8557774.1 TonB-dependent receptor [Hymenobacter negativus]MBH8567701.1 TonB-dependent receptor [Hymenobacter negativus]MBR7207435.1 TonB-dependent receptor [Microvirga sp. STS02]